MTHVVTARDLSGLLGAGVSRRGFLGASAAAVAAAVLDGCSGDGGDSQPAIDPNATPTPGGRLRTAFFFDYDGLDPAQSGFGFPVFQRLYSYLHHIDGRSLEVIPDLSTAFEQPDELTYVFTLRSGVKFHDMPPVNARELTADDVVYSLKRLTTVFNQIDPGFMTRVVDDVTATGPTTVTLRNKRPYAPTMQVLGGYWYGIVPHEAVDEFGDLTRRALGSGPFMLESFEQETGARVKRNPGYYRQGLPYLDGIDFAVITDQTNLLSQFRAKALDVNTAPLDIVRWESLRDDLDGVQSSKSPGVLDPWIGINLRRKPFDDLRVRQALDLAIDRADIIEKLAFGDGKFNGPIPWGNERWALPQDELAERYRTDTTEARRLLEAAGVSELSLMHRVTPALPYGQQIGEILKEQFRPLGIDLTIDVREQNDWIQTVIVEQDFDTCGFAWFPVLDPTVSLRFIDRDDIFSGLMFGFDDDAITELYLKAQAEFDVEARKLALWELQREVLDFHGPVLHTFDSYIYALWWPWVRNYHPDNLELAFYSAEEWLAPRS
jgi:peptide/nickel transport system substrate-binding protein